MAEVTPRDGGGWLRAKLRSYYPQPKPEAVRALERAVEKGDAPVGGPTFANPFHIGDLLTFDERTLREMLAAGAYGLTPDTLAAALHGAPASVVARVTRALDGRRRQHFRVRLRHPLPAAQAEAARRRLLDDLFWELTYWKTPELYEELVEGERLHPGIFARLAPDLRGKVVLDAGAGSGRATFECLRHGAVHIYAVEPSPGLLHLLQRKAADQPAHRRITPLRGRFDALPLEDDSVDLALSCSAFTAAPEQGGEPGLAELFRVTRGGGKIVLIWPRPEDFAWLATHGFQYVALPLVGDLAVRFRSLRTALRVAHRFYARNRELLRYLRLSRRPEVPFALLGYNPPHDYCWLEVRKWRPPTQ
jgi:ubiquinone/menaquinone biosynthesis C-methylase UbiE